MVAPSPNSKHYCTSKIVGTPQNVSHNRYLSTGCKIQNKCNLRSICLNDAANVASSSNERRIARVRRPCGKIDFFDDHSSAMWSCSVFEPFFILSTPLHHSDLWGRVHVQLLTIWVHVWEEISHCFARCERTDFRKRLRACVNAEGGHFEHLL